MTALTDLMAALTPRQAHWLATRVLRVELATLHHEWLGTLCPCTRIPTPRTAPETPEAHCG